MCSTSGQQVPKQFLIEKQEVWHYKKKTQPTLRERLQEKKSVPKPDGPCGSIGSAPQTGDN